MKRHDHKIANQYIGKCLCGAYPSADGRSWFKIEGAVPAKAKLSPEARAIVKRLHESLRDFKASLPSR